MDELLKIAPNGQWSLEKSMDKKADEERWKKIQEFMERQKKPSLATQLKPTATKPSYPAGMRPAQVATQEHKGDPRNYTDPGTKAEIQRRVANREDLEGRQVISRQNISKPEPLVRPTESAGPADVGLPPQEYYDEEYTHPVSGDKLMQRKQRDRQGTFHNQGATTKGKVVPHRIGYEDENGEFRGRTLMREQVHHWAWDHNNKKWNHVKTEYGASDAPAPKTEPNPKDIRAKEIERAARKMQATMGDPREKARLAEQAAAAQSSTAAPAASPQQPTPAPRPVVVEKKPTTAPAPQVTVRPTLKKPTP